MHRGRPTRPPSDSRRLFIIFLAAPIFGWNRHAAGSVDCGHRAAGASRVTLGGKVFSMVRDGRQR